MYVLMNENDGKLKRHTTKDEALKEAERLCRKENASIQVTVDVEAALVKLLHTVPDKELWNYTATLLDFARAEGQPACK